MPKCGSQCWLCDLPIRFDTYKGCGHGCKYCFANSKRDLTQICKQETAEALRKFVNGYRNREVNWCDWNIPIHWGGLSDPFQPIEKEMRFSYDALKVFAETKYPFIISTKGALIADDEYINLLKQCNCVVQISAVCSKYDRIEPGCPTFDERMKIAEKVAHNVKRLIIRIQPYMHEVFEDVCNNLSVYKQVGAYGIIIEGMKFKKNKPGLIKVAGDFTYPYELIKSDFLRIKDKAHKIGLKVYAGENRLRKFGDSLTCCGIDDLERFVPNTFNLNHLLNGDKTHPTKVMQQVGTAECFEAILQTTANRVRLRNQSFCSEMLYVWNEKRNYVSEVLHVDKKE